MTRSFEAAATQMSAGASALATLSIELAAAKKAAQKLVAAASTAGLTIVDGVVEVPSDADPVVAYGGASVDPTWTVDGKVVATHEIASMQGLVDVAVQRARDADHACSALLDKIAWTDLYLPRNAEGGDIVARANAAVADAYENLDEAGELAPRLARRAQQNLRQELGDDDSVYDFLGGVLEGLWSGVVDTAALAGTLGKAAVGSEAAQHRLGRIWQNLDEIGLGDLINLQAWKEGRYGEFVGTNLWWLVPGGGIVKGGKAAGRIGKTAGIAGGAGGRSASKAARAAVEGLTTHVQGGASRAVHAASLDAASGAAFLHRHYPDLRNVNQEQFFADVANARGFQTNCTRCVVSADHTLSGEGPTSAMPSRTGTDIDIERAYDAKFTPVSSYDEIVHRLEEAGPGSRAIISGRQQGAPGHVFNAINDHGTVVFIDAQRGTLARLTDYADLYYLPTN